MEPIKNSWIAFCILSVASLLFCQQPEPLMNVEDILEQLSSDFHTTETLIALNQSLKQPGITPGLVAAFKRDYFGQPPGANSRFTALSGLTERIDIPPSDLAMITDELEKCSKIAGILSREDESLARIAISILKHYPSAYHEELVLRFVKMDKSTAIDAAVRTLGVIGSERSLATLKTFREELIIKFPGCETIALTDAAISAISANPNRYKASTQTAALEVPLPQPNSEIDSAPKDDNTHIALMVLGLLILVAGWLAFQKFRSSRRG